MWGDSTALAAGLTVATSVGLALLGPLPAAAQPAPQSSVQASVQAWPQRTVTILVPFPPGPAVDLVARLVGARISAGSGQTVVVENRTGANGTIAANAVARAAPDGYTLVMATAGTHVTAVHLMKSLPYDPVKDFTPIIAAVEPATCLAINAALPPTSVETLIAYARARPGELAFGSSGIGSVFHLMGALFNQTAGLDIKHVAYRGVEPAMQDTIGGHIAMTFIAVSNAVPPQEAGQVKILAVLEPKRYPRLPNVRSMSEVLPSFRKPSSWFGVFGPPGMAPEVVARINALMGEALADPEIRAKLDGVGLDVIGGTPEAFAALLADGIERYGRIIRDAGLQPN